MMAKNGRLRELLWFLGALLLLLIAALTWSWSPSYASLRAARFDFVPLGREELTALPGSVRGFLLHSDPEISVPDFAEAARRAEFEPRLPGQNLPSPKLFVVAPIRTRTTIHTAQIQTSLARVQGADLPVPRDWDGVILEVKISAGIVADYGRFRLGQRLPLEYRAPDSFPLDRFFEVMFRIGGMTAVDASALRKRFHEQPAEFLILDPRYRIDGRQVQLASKTGVLLRYPSDDGLERLTLAWNGRDRTYFLSAIGSLTEDEAFAIANSLE